MADRLKQRKTESAGATTAVEKADKAAIEKLAEKAKHGNSDALYALCQAIAKSVLFRMSCKLSAMDAEDAAQEVLLIVCTNIHTLKEPKAFGGWLNSIIMNEIRRHIASNAKQADVLNMGDYLENMAEANDDFLPSEYVIKEEDRKAVMDIVRQLPERQSEAVMLHYYEGMSITETAEAMGIVRQNVNRYLILARDKIKSGLQQQAKSSNSLYSISLLPIGGLLIKVLQDEAALMPPVNEAIIAKVVSSSSARPGNTSAKKTGVGDFLLRAVPAIVFSISAAIALVGGLLATGVIPYNQAPPQEQRASITNNVSATVLFSGGNSVYEYINPQIAQVQTGSDIGAVTIRKWSILAVGGTSPIYKGEGGDANSALAELSRYGKDGEYEIIFSIQDGLGDTYTLRRTFFIRTVNTSL